jgi:hypothetical protein
LLLLSLLLSLCVLREADGTGGPQPPPLVKPAVKVGIIQTVAASLACHGFILVASEQPCVRGGLSARVRLNRTFFAAKQAIDNAPGAPTPMTTAVRSTGGSLAPLGSSAASKPQPTAATAALNATDASRLSRSKSLSLSLAVAVATGEDTCRPFNFVAPQWIGQRASMPWADLISTLGRPSAHSSQTLTLHADQITRSRTAIIRRSDRPEWSDPSSLVASCQTDLHHGLCEADLIATGRCSTQCKHQIDPFIDVLRNGRLAGRQDGWMSLQEQQHQPPLTVPCHRHHR